MNTIAAAVCAVLASAAAFAQSSPARLEFEVASIKPAPRIDADTSQVKMGLHIDGSQIHINGFALKDYIRIAYRLKDYQVTGPDWLVSERFEIDAKLPDGATRDQVPEMLQALLADRFQLKTHRGSKEFPVYALSVGGGGLKMKETPLDPAGDGGVRSVQVAAEGGRKGGSVNLGNGAAFTFGDNRVGGIKLTMAQFVDTLGRFMDRPVVDMTGLTGRYDFTIELAPEDYRAMVLRSALSAGVSLDAGSMRAFEGVTGGSLFAGLRALGLRLEPRKAPLEVLIVDRILKSPAEN